MIESFVALGVCLARMVHNLDTLKRNFLCAANSLLK